MGRKIGKGNYGKMIWVGSRGIRHGVTLTTSCLISNCHDCNSIIPIGSKVLTWDRGGSGKGGRWKFCSICQVNRLKEDNLTYEDLI
jgi:hypothetical protein